MLMPELERDLVQAAARAGSRRRRRMALVGACAAACAALAAAVAIVIESDSGEPVQRPAPAQRQATPCEPGRPPAGARDWRWFDPRPIRSLTVLGCARLEDGRQIELIARRFKGRGLCLDIHVAGTDSVLACAVARHNERKPPAVAVSSIAVAGTDAAARLKGAMVVGWTRWDVKRVELRSRDARRDVTLIEVSTVPLVLAAGQHRPFGIFVFKPSKQLRTGQLVAFDARGERLGAAQLPRVLDRG